MYSIGVCDVSIVKTVFLIMDSINLTIIKGIDIITIAGDHFFLPARYKSTVATIVKIIAAEVSINISVRGNPNNETDILTVTHVNMYPTMNNVEK